VIPNRVGRLELLFWWAAAIVGGGIVLSVVAALTGKPFRSYPMPVLPAVVLICVSVVMLKAILSRLHDIGRSGWSLLFMFVPLVNLLMVLFLVFMPGQEKTNSYGEPVSSLDRLRKTTSSQMSDRQN
jgi:uncharacterized membrane protein YhaH (DUF805 family)